MKIVLIGAGNVATQMGRALVAAGHQVVQVYSRTMSSAAVLADRLHCDATDNTGTVDKTADLYIFSVKDDVLPALARQLAPGREGGVFVHTAGSVEMGVFEGLLPHFGVIYPMQTFSKARDVDFEEIPVFLEASDGQTRQLLETFAATFSKNVIAMDSAGRRQLHLAAVFACNFVNHCYALSAEILERNGLSFDVMQPLVEETARKVRFMRPAEAQTGPAVRYDKTVINRQSALLADDRQMRAIYELMSESIHRLALEKQNRHDKL